MCENLRVGQTVLLPHGAEGTIIKEPFQIDLTGFGGIASSWILVRSDGKTIAYGASDVTPTGADNGKD